MPLTSIVLAPLKVTLPETEEGPTLVCNVLPLRVRASAPTATFRISSIAPEATVVLPADVPRPVALLTIRVPSETVVVPL